MADEKDKSEEKATEEVNTETDVELNEPKKNAATSKKKSRDLDVIDWAKEFDIEFDGKKLDELLKRHGIYTREDFLAVGVPRIAAILMAMYIADAQTLTVQVRQKLKKEA